MRSTTYYEEQSPMDSEYDISPCRVNYTCGIVHCLLESRGPTQYNITRVVMVSVPVWLRGLRTVADT